MRPMWSRLAAREQEFIDWAESGLPYHEIARQMGISAETLKEYNRRICDKLGCDNKLQAVVTLLKEKHAAEIAELAIPVS